MKTAPLTQRQQHALADLLAAAFNHYGVTLNGLHHTSVRECLEWVAEEAGERLTKDKAAFVADFKARKA